MFKKKKKKIYNTWWWSAVVGDRRFPTFLKKQLLFINVIKQQSHKSFPSSTVSFPYGLGLVPVLGFCSCYVCSSSGPTCSIRTGTGVLRRQLWCLPFLFFFFWGGGGIYCKKGKTIWHSWVIKVFTLYVLMHLLQEA